MKKHYKISLSNLSMGSSSFYLTKSKTPLAAMRFFILLAVVFLSLATFAQVNLEEGLVAYYPFNGNANDESGNGNDGTVNGATLIVDRFGNAGNAYEFDGVNDFINCGNSSTLNWQDSDYSISVWVKRSSSGVQSSTHQVFIGKQLDGNPYRGWFFRFETNNLVNFSSSYDAYPWIGNGYVETTNPFFNTDWDNYIGVLNGQDQLMKLYVNGQLNNSSSGSNTYNIDNASDLFIGRKLNGEYFPGQIDDIRIYNRALTEAEIQELYGGGEEPNLSLTGSIVEEANGQAIEGASIEITNIATGTSYNTQSNSQGSYQFVNLPIGNYTVEVSKTGHITQTFENVEIDNEAIVLLNFQLVSVISLSGLISDAQNSNMLEGAVVLLTGANFSEQITTDETGVYEFNNLAAGTYNITVIKDGYQTQNRYLNLSGHDNFQENFALIPDSDNSLAINESLIAYADEIWESPNGYFTLSGNVNINNILYFDGEVDIDKRPGLAHPEISGYCGFYACDIANSEAYVIKQGNSQFKYYVDENSILPQSQSFLLDAVFLIGGFGVTIGELIVDPEGDFVEIRSIAKMPFPLDKVADELLKKYSYDLPFYVKEMSASRIFSKVNGLQTAVDINDLSANFGIVALEGVNLYWNTETKTYGGGFTLKIPGTEKKDRKTLDSLLVSPELINLPVELRDENQQIIDSLAFGDFLELYQNKGPEFLVLGAQIEFTQGAINKIIFSIGTHIPLGATGLFITKITGGLEDLATKNWKIKANVDIELGVEIGIWGSPLKLENFGVEIQPWKEFTGKGAFKVFDQPVSDGSIKYSRKQGSLKAECNLNLNNILTGNSKFNLKGGQINGTGILTIQTPGNLPWGLGWAENKNIGSARATLNNQFFQSEVSISWIQLAQKMEFGNPIAPWFYFYLGKNLNDLHNVWKGDKDGKQAIIFQVPENAKQILIVAMDTLNLNTFDFSTQSPSGQIIDQANAFHYELNEEHQQTIMSVLNPMEGDWYFLTDYPDDIALYTSVLNQQPTTLTTEPQSRKSRSNQISLNFNDYADTLNIQVFYDDDSKNFDGSLIDNFTLINNGILEFVWQNDHVPNGEYYIYCRVDDGYNTPVLQYAPGSVWVENDMNIETPQNFTAIQENQQVMVSWDKPELENTIGAAVYYKNISTGHVDSEAVSDSTALVLSDLDFGQEYQMWACFINDNGTYSEPSNKVNLIFSSQSRNNPPYFTLDPDSMFVFVVDQEWQYNLTANDADGNPLTFDIPNDTLGITLNGNEMLWTPSDEQKGVYNLMLTVTDGSAVDTTYQELLVYTQHQVSVDLAFSSVNLYEDDNMFVKISNYFCPDYYQQATLRNMRTQEEVPVECRRVNDFDFIGQFGLSFIKRSEIPVANGDTIELKYNDGKEEYLAYAYYDSLPQPSDQTPPGTIADLQLDKLPNNQLKLKWTATGNNDNQGKAYKYDIRYAYQPINAEDVYFTAFILENYPYPSLAGELDSLILDLTMLTNVEDYDTVYFSVKAEDEMQNRGVLSNSPGEQCLLSPQSLQAEIVDVFIVNLDWAGPAKGMSTFEYYKLYRKYKQGLFYEIATGLENTDFNDNLKDNPDGQYQYAVQAIYETGVSDTLYSDVITIDRFEDVNILCSLEDSTNYQGINFSMQGLDSTYAQTFSKTTNMTGLVLLADVFKTEYAVNISLDGFDVIIDTIEITDQQSVFSYKLWYSARLVNLDIPKGWSGISSSVLPENDTIETLTNSIVDQLIILQNDNGMYWPGQNVNTLGNWNMDLGYKIKVAENVNMTISGNRLENQNLTMDLSWNLMPVLSECPADVADLFSGKDVSIVKEVAGWRVYWPEFGINTLGELQPGKAYFALMGSEEEIEFPECETPSSRKLSGSANWSERTDQVPNEAPGQCGSTPFPPAGGEGGGAETKSRACTSKARQDGVNPTAISHNIALPVSANTNSMLSDGDVIGVFDISGSCYSLAEWTGTNTALTAFGDDPMTPEKDGFDQGETMVFKLFRMEDESEITLDVEYNYSMPQHDAFAENGLSAINNLKTGNTGFENTGQVQQSQIVPNPAHDAFTLILDSEPQSEGTLELYNLKGQMMMQVKINAKSTKVEINDLPAGVYIANISIDNQTMIKQLIKH